MKSVFSFLTAAAAIPLAIALAYPVSSTAQAQAQAQASGGGGPPRHLGNGPAGMTPPGGAPGPGRPGAGAPSGMAAVPISCAGNFQLIDKHLKQDSGGGGTAGPGAMGAVEHYSCQSEVNSCPMAKRLAIARMDNTPEFKGLQKLNAGAGSPDSGKLEFKIKYDWKVGTEFDCESPVIQCMSPSANRNAAGGSAQVVQLGNKVIYKCTYYWLNG